MSAVERPEKNRLGTLAERINAEHRACAATFSAGIDHAMEAGRLLAEVKESLPHGAFGPWLKANFVGSDRTARAYLRLHDHRDELEAKRQSSATLSIDRALKMLKLPKRPLWEQNLPFDPAEQPGPDPDVLRGMEEEQAAWDELRRRQGNAQAELRAAERAAELRGIVEALARLEHGYRPEEAGEELARVTGEGRALEVLRGGIPWLQRTLEEAEQQRARMQGGA